MSIYIHIPFCSNICSYCDFCKVFKNNGWIDQYLDALEKEITLNYKGEKIKTLYIGGGTPSSLNLNELEKLFSILKTFDLDENAEITIETNTEDLTKEKIDLLKKHVNRLSIGIQTFNQNILKKLNRKLNLTNLKLAFKNFNNINVDLMYGFSTQNIEDLKKDIQQIIDLNPKHISTYCLILEPHTKLYIENYEPLNDDNERDMYDFLVKTLTEQGYIQYELSNFSKKNYQSKHNLVYWNNEKYYGFGLGANGYINNIRYENTRSLTNYFKGNYILNQHEVPLYEQIQEEFFVGLRKISGINKNKFYEKYNIHVKEIDIVKSLLNQRLLLENKENLYLNPDYLYTSNEILLNFLEIDDSTLHKH